MNFLLLGERQSGESGEITLGFDGKLVKVHTEFEVVLADHNIQIPGADSKVGIKVNFALENKAN